jgi:hypothetical protein
MEKKPTSLFLDPPWKAVFGGLTAVVIVACVLLRLSELGPGHVQEACRTALLIGVGAGLCGLYPVLVAMGGSGWSMMAGAFIGGLIRLIVTTVGFVVIVLFTQIHAVWLFVFCGGIYAVMLLLDTLLTIRLIRRKRWDKEIDGAEPEWPTFGR